MALLSQLVDCCVEQGVDSAPTLNLFARRLREAGRVSKAGRGRGAAHMTNLDAARFLIACAACDRPEEAAGQEEIFSRAILRPALEGSVGRSHRIDTAQSLDEALATVLGHITSAEFIEGGARMARVAAVRGRDEPIVSCSFEIDRPQLRARIRIYDRIFSFSVEDENARLAKKRQGKQITARFDEDVMRAVATLIRGDQ